MKIFLFAVLLLLSSCHKKQPPQQVAIPVSVIEIVPQTIPANFEFVGVAESSHIVELRARVEGYLEQIDYKEGSFVQKDTLMFVLDQRPFIDDVNMAKGELEQKLAKLWDAQQIKNRMIPLYEQNAISQRDLDNALANELAEEADVQTAIAKLQKAELNLSFASIQAPVSGMASKAKYREGALISPGPDSLLTTMYVVDPIWVNFSVSEGDILKARMERAKGLIKYPDNMNFKIEVILADNTVMPAEGVVDFTDPALQQSTGTMLVRSVLPNPNKWLLPGQFVRVVVKGAVRPNAIIVPQSAVQLGQNGIFVYVVDKNNRVELRPVVTGDWYLDYWVITQGLSKGERVVANGMNRVQNQSLVQVVSSNPPSPKKPASSSEQETLGL